MPQELEILKFLQSHGACNEFDISQALDLSNIDTVQTLRDLLDDKLVKQTHRTYTITPKGIELLLSKPTTSLPEILKSLSVQEDLVLKIVERYSPISLERIAKIIGTPKTKISKFLKSLMDLKLIHEQNLAGRRRLYHYVVQGLCPEVPTEYKHLMIQVFNRKYSPLDETNKELLKIILDED